MTLEKPHVVETVEFEKSIYEYTREGIVIISIKDDSHIDIGDTKAEYIHSRNKKEYLPMRTLIRPGKNTSVSKEVREFINLPEAKELVNCQAILVDNLAHKIIANFMMKLYPQPNKFKVFSSEEEAIDWLRSQA